MKRIPLFLVLTLMVAWGYTSWYWYTCNIQGACQNNATQVVVTPENIQEEQVSQEIVESREGESLSNSSQEVQSLSREDVLVGDSFIPQAPVNNESEEDEDNSEETETQKEELEIESLESVEVTQANQTGTISESASGALAREMGLDSETSSEIQFSTNLCVSPLVGPISISGSNSVEDVIKLETFLIANAYLTVSDGVYRNADFEAVKQLQLDYKEQMLDPWGIDTPTGYVGRTTVATINNISCN